MVDHDLHYRMALGGKRPTVNGKTTRNEVAKIDPQMKAKLAVETAEKTRQGH